MNKKAFVEDAFYWIVRIFGTTITISMIVFLLVSVIENKLELDDLRYYPVAERALYSKTCFVYEDQGRPYPGIISSEKFTDEIMDSCMSQGSALPIAAKLILHYPGEDGVYHDIVLHMNERYFSDVLPLTFSNLFMRVQKNYFVLVEEEGKFIPGSMMIEVVWRK